MEHYNDLLQAIGLINQAQKEITKSDRVMGVIEISPAWAKMYRVAKYLKQQANAVL